MAWVKPRGSGRWRGVVLPAGVFAAVFAGAVWLLFPAAPGKAWIEDQMTDWRAGGAAYRQPGSPTRGVDFRSCRQARAGGRVNIPRGDPAYRASLDRDNDGLACEPLPKRRGLLDFLPFGGDQRHRGERYGSDQRYAPADRSRGRRR